MTNSVLPVPVTDKETTPGAVRRPRNGLLLGIILTGQFMALLDVFIVNVAAPTIRADLHASGAGLQLIVAGYTIAYAVLLITGARIGDLLGHRRIFLGGLALFTAASLACGLAQSTGQLIGFRFVQGAGSALMIPQVLSLIQLTFSGEARAKALSVYSAVLASGAAIGQSLGGVLVSADVFGTGWRPVFLVNVPIGLAMLVVAPRVIPADVSGAPERRRGLDLPGLLTLGAAVTLFTVPLVLGQEEGWPVWGWVCLALSVALFGLFTVLEARLARRGGAPLVSGRVLRAPGMARAATMIGLSMAVNAGFLFSIALHLQTGLGDSALRTGLTFAVAAVFFGGVGLNWRRLPQRWHRWLAPAGFAVAALSFAGLGLALRGGGHGGFALFAGLAGIGAGLGAAFSPTLTRALGKVAPQDAADASGLLATVTQLGMLVGVATLGTLFLNRLDVAGPHPAAHAFAVTAAALTVLALAGALLGLRRDRS
ncbi:MFS transporter [Streptomyces sp. H39-S7]|uniref:MFS transporter n=1 Tax=Streptomyces sp. H39-S7 TaxID=3004357 RepID=UPI0022AF1D91|nr:MFS transporter [Streptomyces sp. H39-S7]MCZ4124117.1 MFS transporter [Streptomyces sp. H39-S7]